MTDLAGGDSTWAAAAVGGTWEATHGGQPSSKRSHPLTTLLLLLVFLTLAGAIASGAMANIVELWLSYNKIGDIGLTALADAVRSGALGSLFDLQLQGNRIGDEGMKAFSSAIATGALAKLEELVLTDNAIGDVGMQALAGAVSKGALASLKDIYLNEHHPALRAACKTRGVNCC